MDFCKKGDPLRGYSEVGVVFLRQSNTCFATQFPGTEPNEWVKNFSRATYMTNKWPQSNKLIKLRDQSSYAKMKCGLIFYFDFVHDARAKSVLKKGKINWVKKRQFCFAPQSHHSLNSAHQTLPTSVLVCGLDFFIDNLRMILEVSCAKKSARA